MYTQSTISKKQNKLRSSGQQNGSSHTGTVIRIILSLILLLFAGGIGFADGSLRGIIDSRPLNVGSAPENIATQIYDDTGETVIQRLYDYTSNRLEAEYEDIPDSLKNAFVAIEDERFYVHHGIDVKGIFRALINDLKTGSTSQGASTITQQLVKNKYFDTGNEQNIIAKIVRKIQEQYIAVELEKKESKNDILKDYLNTINLGKGYLGIRSASEYYFHKEVQDLTLSECACLAAITKNPTRYNPVDHPLRNQKRRELVLKKMLNLNYISSTEYEEALAEKLSLAKNAESQTNEVVYTYFVDAVVTQVLEDLQTKLGYTQKQAYNMLYRGGLKIHTTQNLAMQSIADNEINNADNYPVETTYSVDEYQLLTVASDGTEMEYSRADVKNYFIRKNSDPDYSLLFSSRKKAEKALKSFRSSREKAGETVNSETYEIIPQPQLSYTLIDQSTGAVKVLVGGRGQKYDSLSLNRATSVKRQPGSTFKILSAYAPGIDAGVMTLASTYDDATYQYENGREVSNADHTHKGLMTIREAIRTSNNIVAVKALTQLTPQAGYNYLEKLGFTTLVRNEADSSGKLVTDVTQSLALGGITYGVTNLELTAAYAAIANKGAYNKPIYYTSIEDKDGKIILENKTSSRQVMKESTAWLLTNAMKDVVSSGTGTQAQLSGDMAVAGKTGTTSNSYDYWFCGYTPYYTASIWTGYDYNTTFENNDDFHKSIWAKIMNQVIETQNEETRDFDECEGIEQASVCAKSGKLPISSVCENDPEHSMVYEEYFAEGTVPTEQCDSHISLTLCSKSQRLFGDYCPDKYKKTIVFRVRPEGSEGTTDDSKYTAGSDTQKDCNIHTEEWKKKEEEKKRKKEEEKQKKKEEEEKKKKEQLEKQKQQEEEKKQQEASQNTTP